MTGLRQCRCADPFEPVSSDLRRESVIANEVIASGPGFNES